MKYLCILLCTIMGFTLHTAKAETTINSNTSIAIVKNIDKASVPRSSSIIATSFNIPEESAIMTDCIEIHFSCGSAGTICGYEWDLETLIEAVLAIDDILCP